jgi:hypothetical protein
VTARLLQAVQAKVLDVICPSCRLPTVTTEIGESAAVESQHSRARELEWTAVGFNNLITPPGRTREPHRRDDHDAGHECRHTPSLPPDVPAGAA